MNCVRIRSLSESLIPGAGSLGSLNLPLSVGLIVQEQLPANRIELLPIGFADLARVEKMPFHHRDPFDRMRAAQAMERDVTIVSADSIFEKYGVKRVW